MTLIAALVDKQRAILVADRRLTDANTGQVVEDEANKCGTVRFVNGVFAVAFTGLASIGSQPTAEWLIDALAEVGQAEEAAGRPLAAGTVLAAFRDRATADFRALRRVSRENKRLSIVGAGYLHGTGTPVAALWVVSNFEGSTPAEVMEPTFLDEAADEFTFAPFEDLRPAAPDTGHLARLEGLWPYVDKPGWVKLVTMLYEGRPTHALLAKAVQVIRLSSASDARIGSQATGIVITPDGRSESTYFTARPSRVIYAPFQVFLRPEAIMTVLSTEIGDSNGDYIAGPPLHPSANCWCGSRRQYRRCHGNADNLVSVVLRTSIEAKPTSSE